MKYNYDMAGGKIKSRLSEFDIDDISEDIHLSELISDRDDKVIDNSDNKYWFLFLSNAVLFIEVILMPIVKPMLMQQWNFIIAYPK